MKADITMTRKQAETLMAGIAHLFEAYNVPKRDTKRLVAVAAQLDVVFGLGVCDCCGRPTEEARS